MGLCLLLLFHFNFVLNIFHKSLPQSYLKFHMKFMRFGNYLSVEQSFFLALKYIKLQLKVNPFFFFFEAIESIRFSIFLQIFERKKKKTVKKVIIPKLIKRCVRYKYALYLLSKSIKLRKEHSLYKKISNELFDILLYGNSNVYLKKQEIYNYAHFFHYNSFNIN